MRTLIAVGVAVMLALVSPPASAQEAEALRKELEQMRKNFEAMQQQYQKSIDALSERLRRLESQPAPVTAAPPPAPASTAQLPPGPSPGLSPSTPSAVDLLGPRQPFALYQQRGSGQLPASRTPAALARPPSAKSPSPVS